MNNTMKTAARKILIATVTAAVLLCASIASAGTVWYTSEAPGSNYWSHLYSVNTDNMAVTDLGEIKSQRYMTDIARADDGTLYGVGWTNAQAKGSSKLYKLTPGSSDEPAQWEIETVKSNGMSRSVNAMTMAGDSIYIAGDNGQFQKMDYNAKKDRWEISKSGNLGRHISSDGDLAFSNDGKTLYATVNGGYLATVNFDEKSKHFGEVNVIGHTGYDRIMGLAMLEDGLYATASKGLYDDSFLVKLDTMTAAAKGVGPLGTAAWGATAGSPIPEPTMLALLLAGGGLLIYRGRRAHKQTL